MKICVTGKGGSGKSLVSALLAKVLAAMGYDVLLTDADESNMGLQRMLGIEGETKTLMEHMGGKASVKQKMRGPSAISAGHGPGILPEGRVRLADLPPEYLSGADGVKLLKIGKIEQALEGCACPMGILARDFLARLDLGKRDVVVIDTEAGIEHFGRGVESSVDRVLIVVDPSFESVLLAQKITRLSAALGLKASVVLNKVTPELEQTLTAELQARDIPVAGSIRYDSQVFEACLRGQPLGGGQAERDVAALVGMLGLG